MRQIPNHRLHLGLGTLWLLLSLSLLYIQHTIPRRTIVTWETGSEQNTAGFNLYRRATPDEPFVQLNDALIPARGSSSTGAQYRYEDTAVQPGTTYTYLLEEVELDGTTTRYPNAIQSQRVQSTAIWSWATAVAALIAITLLTLGLRHRFS